MDAFSSIAHHISLQLMQHEVLGRLPPQGGSEGPTFITRTAPITRRPITYLLIGLLSLFGTHASAKSSCEPKGEQRQEWRSGMFSQASGDVRMAGQPEGVDRQDAQAGEVGGAVARASAVRSN